MMVDYYPPPPKMGTEFAQTVLPYSFLFLTGTLGNTAVLCYVFFITRSLKSSVTALGNTFVYIVALSAVDLLVTASIPFSLANSILNNWPFGIIGCKIHWAVELSNKMCSIFLLTALAFDRYMAICRPENKRVHQMRATILITSSLAILSFCLILPVVFSATLRHQDNVAKYTLYRKDRTTNEITKEDSFNVVQTMCVDGMKKDMKVLLCGFLIFFAFLLPCSLLTFFYTKIVLRLRKQQRTMLQSRIPIRRITIYTMAVTLFYLLCQMTYWIPQIYMFIVMIRNLRPNPSFFVAAYYTHLCPFVSAAFNWIFYARMNSQFKKGLILVTERMIRKRTRKNAFRSLQNGVRDKDTLDEMGLDLISRTEDVVALCPNCEAQLTLRNGTCKKVST